VFYEHVDVVEQLIDDLSNIDLAMTTDGVTPLLLVVPNGHSVGKIIVTHFDGKAHCH
jgi:hypothetical protein